MKSIINGNREVNWSMLTSLLYPIRWKLSQSDVDDNEVRQYYHKFSLEAMSLEDVFLYLENRCSHSNVYLPPKGHRDFKELTRCVQWMVEREDLKPGQTLVFFEGTSILEEVKK
jgi:hypothetical protein